MGGRKLDHIHLVPNMPPAGEETVIPGTRYKPDARDVLDPTHIYEFLGNYWHGYPIGHPMFYEIRSISSTTGKVTCYNELYDRTMERMDVIKSLGYSISYVWEHEFNETMKVRCPRPILGVVHKHCYAV